jgi:hypothetical protein
MICGAFRGLRTLGALPTKSPANLPKATNFLWPAFNVGFPFLVSGSLPLKP